MIYWNNFGLVLKKVHLSMPGYISNALVKYRHGYPKRHQDAPVPYTRPKYGFKKAIC